MVKLVTFKTNQTILADVSYNEDMTAVILAKPVQVIVQPTQQGNNMGFAPFLDYCEEFDKGIVFLADDILTITTPVRELLNQYNKVFGSGIEVVSSIARIK